MTSWLIFIAYVAVGVMRYRVYFERVHDYEKKEWPSLYKREKTNSIAFGCALGLSSIWPFYETLWWFRFFVLKQMESEEQRLLNEDRIIKQARDILTKRGIK
jgi:hypothetical protein